MEAVEVDNSIAVEQSQYPAEFGKPSAEYENGSDTAANEKVTAKNNLKEAEMELNSAESETNGEEREVNAAESEVNAAESDLNSVEGELNSAESELNSADNVVNAAENEADTLEDSVAPAETVGETYPTFEIGCAETISEDAFEEEKTVSEDILENGDSEALFKDYDVENNKLNGLDDNGLDDEADISTKESELDEEESSPKEQEPVNESNETEKVPADPKPSPVKKESDDGDEPNEDPNRDGDGDSDLEMDPEIAAAMEASLLETEQMDEKEDDDEPKSDEAKEPLIRFCNETEVDEDEEDVDDPMDVDDHDAIAADDEELTLEGEAVTGEMEIGGIEIGSSISISNPLEADGNPLDEDPGDYDPLVEDGCGIAVDEESNEFLDRVNSGFMTQIHSFPELSNGKGARGPRGPYKRRNRDEDYDPLAPSAPVQKRSKPSGTLTCSLCHFPFPCIGELKLHRFTDHENQAKPNFLDLAEVAIGKCKTKGGVSNQRILKEILNDPMTTDTNQKAKIILNKALKFGVEKGRLKLGKPGKKATTQRYYLVKRKKDIKKVFEQFNKNKKLIEFNEDIIRNPPKPPPKPARSLAPKLPGVSITKISGEPSKAGHITQPDPKKFGRGKRTGSKPTFGGEITLDSDSSDDDIAIISEKITVKPKKKVVVVRGPGPGKGRGVTKVAPKSSPAARKLPSNLVKVGGSKPVQARPVAPAAAPKKPTKTAFDDSDEEEDLTCKMCQSSFWFKSQLVEHLTNTHNVENPEKYFRKQ